MSKPRGDPGPQVTPTATAPGKAPQAQASHAMVTLIHAPVLCLRQLVAAIEAFAWVGPGACATEGKGHADRAGLGWFSCKSRLFQACVPEKGGDERKILGELRSGSIHSRPWLENGTPLSEGRRSAAPVTG